MENIGIMGLQKEASPFLCYSEEVRKGKIIVRKENYELHSKYHNGPGALYEHK